MPFLAGIIPAAIGAAATSAVGSAVGGALAPKNQFNPNQNQVPLPMGTYSPALQGAIGQPAQTLQGQNALIQLLGQQIAGGGPNLAQTQLQAATDRTMKQAAALGASQRGMNPSLVARQILQQQTGANQEAANESAQLRQQQQLGAQGQLGNVLAQQGQLGISQLGELGQLQQAQNSLAVQQAQGMGNQSLESQLANQRASQAGAGGFTSGLSASIAPFMTPNKPGLAMSRGGEVHDMKDGGEVPGQAQVSGDSPQNDTVHAMLSPGEVVIPRSVVKGPNLDPKKVFDFVQALKNEPAPTGYGRVLQARRQVRQYYRGGKV